ncbi:hypothetical protein Snoj_40430 [Streptomyces nojiriensis]|uniref:Uncharacterized protein n=1 Tax=Streptomyces nojiriensis TaxID=66374 RepID=A0ABQ3SQN6_9ACTN|nr:hypothetical protein GCM10010205_09080 [Streptomyces nojiriensis]GHI70125.1 hypothetical protein Snoj_40430 [Streptomyces nojiriensis]
MAEGKQQEATVFCIGWASDTPNARFGEWTKALDHVTAINQSHFDLAVREGRRALTTRAPTGRVPVRGLRPHVPRSPRRAPVIRPVARG